MGFWAGNMGELGVAIGQAATTAWNYAGGIVDAALSYVTNVASTIGSWGLMAWNFLTGLFTNEGKELPAEEPEVVTPEGRPGPWSEKDEDDFLLDSAALEDAASGEPAPWESEFDWQTLLEDAATSAPMPVFDPAMDAGLAYVQNEDWAFA